MVLPFLKIVGGTVVQLCPAIRTFHKAGKHTVLACLCGAAFVLPQFLYPVPLRLFDNGGMGVTDNLPLFRRVLDFLFALVVPFAPYFYNNSYILFTPI